MKLRVDVADAPVEAVHYLMSEFEQLDYITHTEVNTDFDLIVETIPDEQMHPSCFTSIGGLLSIFLVTTGMLESVNRDKIEITFDDNTILDIFE